MPPFSEERGKKKRNSREQTQDVRCAHNDHAAVCKCGGGALQCLVWARKMFKDVPERDYIEGAAPSSHSPEASLLDADAQHLRGEVNGDRGPLDPLSGKAKLLCYSKLEPQTATDGEKPSSRNLRSNEAEKGTEPIMFSGMRFRVCNPASEIVFAIQLTQNLRSGQGQGSQEPAREAAIDSKRVVPVSPRDAAHLAILPAAAGRTSWPTFKSTVVFHDYSSNR